MKQAIKSGTGRGLRVVMIDHRDEVVKRAKKKKEKEDAPKFKVIK